MEKYEKIKPYKALANKVYSEIRITDLREDNRIGTCFCKWNDPDDQLYGINLDGNSYLGRGKGSAIDLSINELEDQYILFKIFKILKKRLLDQLDDSDIVSSENTIVKSSLPDYVMSLDTDIYVKSVLKKLVDNEDVVKIDGVLYKITRLGSKDKEFIRLVVSYRCLYDTLVESVEYLKSNHFREFTNIKLYFYMNDDGSIDEDKPIYTLTFPRSDDFLGYNNLIADVSIDRFNAHDMRLSKTVNSVLYTIPSRNFPSYSLLLDKDTDRTYMEFDIDYLGNKTDLTIYILSFLKKIVNKSNPYYVSLIQTNEKRKIDEIDYIINELSKDGIVNEKYVIENEALKYRYSQLKQTTKGNKIVHQIHDLIRNDDFLVDNYKLINVKDHYYIFNMDDDDLFNSYTILIQIYEGMNRRKYNAPMKRVILEVDLNGEDIMIKDNPNAHIISTEGRKESNMITQAAEKVYGGGDFYTMTKFPGLNFF